MLSVYELRKTDYLVHDLAVKFTILICKYIKICVCLYIYIYIYYFSVSRKVILTLIQYFRVKYIIFSLVCISEGTKKDIGLSRIIDWTW